MEIRPIHHDECEELGRITVLAYRALNGGATLGTYEGELLDVTARQLDSEVYVAIDDDGNLLGGVTYVSGPKRKMSEFEDPEAAGIRMLAVDPRYQGLGAGRALVETCITRASFQHRQRIILHSTPVMTIARDMYLRLGFEPSPALDIWFEDVRDESGDPFHLIAYTLAL